MKTPLIFDIKRASTADGPGLRTAVFFKGCNLDCAWCHNPEGKAPQGQLAYFKEKCIACGACQEACANPLSPCTVCGKCTTVCPTNAKKRYGSAYTVDQLLKILQADAPYFDATGGGVTFSGGECMLYPAYLSELAKKCCKNGISVAIDTAGCVPFSHFEQVLPYADLFLYDIKCLDPALHQAGTGQDNALILQNLEHLQKTGKPILIRIPVIPNFNDGEELERMERFCEDKGLPYETLAYHAYGIDKQVALRQGVQKPRNPIQ